MSGPSATLRRAGVRAGNGLHRYADSRADRCVDNGA